MKFENHYYRNRIQNLRVTIVEKKLKFGLSMAIILIIISLLWIKPINSDFTLSLVFVCALFLWSQLYEFGLAWLIFNPNETSVYIDKNSVILSYLWPKKDIVVAISDINQVDYNQLSDNNEATIISKATNKDLVKLGLDFECHSVNALSINNWKTVSNDYRIELILSFNLKLSDIKDEYLIQKSRSDSDKITKPEFRDMISKRSDVILLGVQEAFNLKNKVELMEQYALTTNYGKEALNFFDGKIVIGYEKDKTPIEIESLIKNTECVYEKL